MIDVAHERYLPGKAVDIYRPVETAGCPVLLLWHGSMPNDRGVLAPVATALAERGAMTIVPDWQSDQPAAGRAELLASLAFARESSECRCRGGALVVGGWSSGASAAADVMLHPDDLDGWRPSAFVGIAGPYGRSPVAGRLVADGRTHVPGGPCFMIHGSSDELVPPQRSRDSCAALAGWGWTVQHSELVADHGGIIGAELEAITGRYIPSGDRDRLAVVARVAVEISTFVHAGPGDS